MLRFKMMFKMYSISFIFIFFILSCTFPFSARNMLSYNLGNAVGSHVGRDRAEAGKREVGSGLGPAFWPQHQ